jgi:ABC-type glycerol-3-phosphate transport system permease component
MDTTIIKKKRFLPFLQSQKNTILFKILNIYLIIGVGSLLVTIFYLIGHLNQADSIIRYCIPGFISGVSSGIFYFIGYQSMISEQHAKST